MRFANPEMLWLMAILLPALACFLIWTWRTKQKLIAQFVQSRLLAHLTVGVSQARQKLRLVLLFSAVALALLALARPQWGFDWEEAVHQGVDIIVAIDTSRSMLAEDLTPNRLTRARLAAMDLMKQAKADRLGLIAFAGSAFLQCPLTLDEQAFRQSVEALDVNIIPQGGTAIGEAIQTAISAFEKHGENHKVLVIFTDGEDHDSEAIALAEKAAKAGIRIFCIGVGTAEGELIRIRDDRGRVSLLKDEQGNVVKSRLNETLLQKIATPTDGFYLPLRGADAMEVLYARGIAPLPKSDAKSKLVKNHREQFRWPLGLAILLLLAETLLPQRKRVRRSEAIATAANEELKKAVVLLLAGMMPIFAAASPGSALRNYESGKYHDALNEFHRLLQQKTNDYRLHFNAGAAAYRAEELPLAQKHFEMAAASPDLHLQQRAYYNLGNTHYQLGEPAADPNAKVQAWEAAVQNFTNALKLNPEDADAKHNLDFVKKKLEELKQQQQDQQQQKSDKNDDSQQRDENQQEQKSQDQQQDSDNQQSQQENESDQEQESQQKSGQENEEKDAGNQQQRNTPNEEQHVEDEGQSVALGEMTPEQAAQLLEMLRQEEKPLIFAPPQKPRDANRPVRDW